MEPPAGAAPTGLSHPDLLAAIFERLPLSEQCATICTLGRAWQQWAAPKRAILRGTRPSMHCFDSRYERLAAFALPLWYVMDGWPRLTEEQRSRAASRAAAHGDSEMLRFARRAVNSWDLSVCEAAAGGGQLAALQWARSAGCPWTEQTCA
jgi:hypothetical protein